MKFKKIMLVSVILLAILTLGAVGAADADALAVDDDSGDVIKSSDDVDLIADDEIEDDPYDPDDELDDEEVEGNGTEIVNMNVEFPKEIAAAKEYTINVTFDKEVTGFLKSNSNTDSYATDLFGEDSTTISFKTCDFGVQTYEIKYFGDDTYAPQTVTGEFTVNSYVIDCADQSVIYGQNLSSYLSVPNGFSNSITLIVDGREYQVSKDEEDKYYFNIGGLKYGDNEVRVICHDETHGDYNGTFTVNASSEIIIPDEASINGANVYLYLPSDATGTLKVYTAIYDDEKDDYVKGTLISSSKMKNGYASVILNNLEWGYNDIYAEYVGDEKYNVSYSADAISVEPQIIVPDLVFPGKDVYAEIYLPKGTSGTFILSEYVWDDDEEGDVLKEYKATVTNGYAKIKLNQLSDGEHNLQAKVVDASGEEIYAAEDEYEVKVITADSISVYGIDDGDEIVYYDDIEVYLPYELNGTVKVYIDDTFIREISADEDYSYVTLPTLKEGTHKFIVKYIGEDFNLTKEITFKVLSCIIDIPDVIDVESDEIRVDLSENITATMDFYVDGKKLYSQKISGADNYVDISSVSMGEHKVKIVVTDDATKKKTTKENTVEFYYSIDIILEDQYNYGEDNEIRVTLPSDVTGDVIVTIDGKKRKWTSDGYEIIVNISDVPIGDHEIVVTHSGDKKYPEDYTEDSFEVVGSITIPDSTSDLISLTLPSNAKGKLILNIYNITGYDDWDEPIKGERINQEIALNKGKATFNPKDLPFGNYWVEASYTGSDYYVDDAESEMSADLNVDYPVESFLNNITTIVVDAPDNEKVNISIGFVRGLDDEKENIITPVSSSVLTGKEYSFIPQQLGTYQLKFSYMVNGKVETDDYYVSVIPNELNIPDEIIRNKTNTVSMTLPDDATGNITVAIYTTKIDDEGDEVLVLNRTITSEVSNGTGSVELPDDLNYDDYVLEVNYTGNKGNFTKQYSSSFTPYISMPKFIGLGDDIFEFDAEGIDGDIAVSIQDKDATAKVVNGKVIVDVPKTISGGRSGGIQITYTDANGVERSISRDLYIKDSVDVNAKATATVGKDLIVKVYLSNRFQTGNVTAKLNGVEKTADIESGYATFNFGKLAYGNYNVEVTYNGNDRVNAASKNITAKVVYNPVIKASNANVFYNDGKYSITLKGYDGKIAKNTYVSFKINGKFFKKVKTNSKGVATIKLTKVQVPKTYKITATALGKSVTKKVTVKQVLTLKTANVKKSAKKLVLTATLKKGKKAIKGKSITFKFNGKKIKTVKTNKKGIAKVTITKATLQKLKAGKKVTYQAIYLKDVVKRTAKVKK